VTAVPQIFQVAVAHPPLGAQPKTILWLVWQKLGPKWRKQFLRWPVHHRNHANVSHTRLRGK